MIVLCTYVSVLPRCQVGVELLGFYRICALNLLKLLSFIIKVVLLGKRNDGNT